MNEGEKSIVSTSWYDFSLGSEFEITCLFELSELTDLGNYENHMK